MRIWALVFLLLVGCSSRCPGNLEVHAARWEYAPERASAEWCAEHCTGPRYNAVLGSNETYDFFSGDSLEALYEGPVRISIEESGSEIHAWNGHQYSTWDIEDSQLVYAKFCGAVPGGWLVSVDLGHPDEPMWTVSLTHPLPESWSLWRNRVSIDVRDGRVYAWSDDGGRFLQVVDAETGRTVGRKCFNR